MQRLNYDKYLKITLLMITLMMSQMTFAKQYPQDKLQQKMEYKQKSNITLNFDNSDTVLVLKKLADIAHKNLIISDDIKSKITLRLHDVSWQSALHSILNLADLVQKTKGNTLLIMSQQNYLKQQQQRLLNIKAQKGLQQLYLSHYILHYANAAVIAKALQSNKNTLLSAQGRVVVDTRSNTLWIKANNEDAAAIKRFINAIDRPIKQVLIKARIVNIDQQYARELGFKFGLGKAVGDDVYHDEDDSEPSQKRTHYFSYMLPAQGLIAGATPATLGMALIKLGSGYLLDLELSAIASEGGAKIISSPRLITEDRKAAHIQVGEEIPYQIATGQGNTAVEFKKALLELKVLPTITDTKHILLKIQVNQDKRGEQTAEGPAIDTREIKTQTLAHNGQTVVLGGIYEDVKINNVQRVPFLGSLPIIGFLFRYKSKKTIHRELLIFITPQIIGSDHVMDHYK